MNVINYVNQTSTGFSYLNYQTMTPKEKAEFKSNSKNNYQFFLCQTMPATLLNGIFKKEYKLTPIENLFLIYILSNKNTNLNEIKENDFIFYNEYFKNFISQDRKINETIDKLVNKKLIEIKQIVKNGKVKGRYIDYTNTIEKINKLFNKLLKEKIEENDNTDISIVKINSYLKNIRENFTFSNGKEKKSLDTHEKEKLLEIMNDDENIFFFDNFCNIPLFLAGRLELKDRIEKNNNSPLLYFFRNFETLKDDFIQWHNIKFEEFENELDNILETKDSNDKRIEELFSLI